MKKFILIPLMLILVAGLVLSGCGEEEAAPITPAPVTPEPAAPEPAVPTPEGPITLKFASWLATTMPSPIDYDPFQFTAERWCDTIEQESGGRIQFERHLGGSLLSMTGAWDGLKAGVADVAVVMESVHPGEFPLTQVLAVPNLFPNASVAAMVTYRLYEEGYLKPEREGTIWIHSGSTYPGDVSCKPKQIRTLEDWKDLKLAAIGEPETSVIKALGAVPVGIPTTEQYVALERGTVDGCVIEFNGQVAYKFYEKAPNLTKAHGCVRHVTLYMNENSYKKLPPDLQELIDKESGMLWSLICGKRFDANFQRSYEFLENDVQGRGYPPIYFPPEDEVARWEAAWQPAVDKYLEDIEAKGLPAREMLARARELVDWYSSWRLGGIGVP